MREGSSLGAIAEDWHWFSPEHLVHEYADDISVGIRDILPLPVHVVRAKNGVVKSEESPGRLQVQLHRVFRDAIGVLWPRYLLFGHRYLPRTVDGDGRSEHEALSVMQHRLIDEVHARLE